jgi:hypothetical protein
MRLELRYSNTGIKYPVHYQIEENDTHIVLTLDIGNDVPMSIFNWLDVEAVPMESCHVYDDYCNVHQWIKDGTDATMSGTLI